MSTQTQAPQPLKIFFHAIDGIAHLTSCTVMGQALAARGHQIYILINESFENQYSKFGFTEIMLKVNKPDSKDPIKQIAKIMVPSASESSKTTLDKLRAQTPKDNTKFMDSMYPTFVAFNPQVEEAIEREKPDLFVLDSILVPPAVQKAGLPWIMLMCSHPFGALNSDKLPPFCSGYPTKSDPSTWVEYRQLANGSFHERLGKYQALLDVQFNYTPAKPIHREIGAMYPISPYLNIYGYPAELDYPEFGEIFGFFSDTFVRVDAFLRNEEQEPFEIPEELNFQPGIDKLIYVSLGSMGSIDVDLMKRICSVLGKSRHKYIVSKGPRSDEYELPENCWGEPFLPQIGILPLVDLVITHAGNTINETLSFGKPMILMPLFADQYDAAQRAHEKGLGIRVEPYSFTEQELLSTIEQLLHESELHQRLQAIKERMAKSDCKQRACERIEQIVTKL